MSLLAALKLPAAPSAAPPAQPEDGVRGRDAAAFEQASKLRDGMKDQLEKGWREAVEIAKKLDPGAKEGFVVQLQAVDKKRQEAKGLDGDPPGQVVSLAAALMGLKQARQAVGEPVSDGTDANTAYKSADGTEVGKPKSSPPAPPPIVAKKDTAESGSTRSKAAPANATLVIDSFAFAKADVPGNHLGELQALRERLARAPGSTVRLLGHTDTVGTERNNRDLGLQRAQAVRAFLTADKGVNAGNIKLDSAGEIQPAAGEGPAKLDPNKGEKNARNRRVEIFVTWSKPLPVPVTDGKAPVKAPQPASDKDPEKTGVRKGITFEHQWDSKEFGDWKVSYVKGSFRVKAKFKGELVQKGSGGKVTEGYTTNKGVKGLIELGKQKAVEIFSGLSLKEVTETFEHELSTKKVELKFQIKATLQTGVSWLSPVVTGSFVLAGAEWEKLKKDKSDFKIATFTLAGGVQAKGTIDVGEGWEANLSVDLSVEGSAGPNWPMIIAKVAEVIATEAAETAAAAEGAEVTATVLSFDALIAAGAVALGASVILGTLKTMVDGEEIRGLSKVVDKTTRAFRQGYAAGILGEKEPSDPLAKAGFGLGQKNFEQSKQAALAKYPLTDKEIRSAIREQVREGWDRLYGVFHPYAQQAVWDAFGSAHAGWVNRNIDPSTIRWGYVAIYGKNPSESDSNYTKYYLK